MADLELVLGSIKTTLQEVRDSIDKGKPAILTIANRHPGTPTRTIFFPGRTPAEAQQFAVLLKILDIIHDCLSTRTVITKRDLYYRHVPLFRNQTTVDRLVDDLAATLRITRSNLYVIGASKGLVYGNIAMRMHDGTSIHCGRVDNATGSLIPPGNLISSIEIPDEIRWCVVVEKYAVFQTICTRLAGFLKTRCVFITGKGYPDISTRELCWRLANHSRRVKIVSLVDFDPDGYEIFNTYRNGSRAMAHENELTVRSLGCLGLKGQHLPDIVRRDWENTDKGQDSLPFICGRDRRKVRSMLERLSEDVDLSAELKRMLFIGIKVEIEAVDGLHTWLEHAILKHGG